MSPSRKAAIELLREFPTAATKTLALLGVQRWPEMWPTTEAARNAIRRLRGASGSKSRRQTANLSENFRPLQSPGDPFTKLPQPRTNVAHWSTLEIPGPARVLVLSDVHIPYHAPAALKAALQHGKQHEANLILLNGDIADFFSISRWENDPRQRDFAAELRDVKAFLCVVRTAFPKARIVYKSGNHEDRYLRYMRLKAPELLGVELFEMPVILELAKYGVEWIDNNRPVRIGELNFLHGHEYLFNISNPVNPARGLFMRGKVHAVCGHFHQSSQHSEKNLEQKVVSTWSTGCLCDLNPEYRPLNNWGHGFAFVEVDKRGAFQVDNLRIISGEIWH